MLGLPSPVPPMMVAWERDDPEYKNREIIFCHLLRLERFYEAVSERVQLLDIFEGCPELTVLWDIVHEFYQAYRKMPSSDIIEAQLAERCLLQPGLDIAYTVSMVHKWMALDEQQCYSDYAGGLLRDIVEQKVKQRLQLTSAAGATESLREELTNAQGLLDAAFLERPAWRNPFVGDPSTFLKKVKRVPIGVDWVDRATGGGQGLGTLTGFIMPSGVGKTTLVWQMAKECVVRKTNAVIFTVEQDLIGDLTLRSYVLASDSTRRDWEDMDFSRVQPEIQRRWHAYRENWMAHLRVFDHWANPSAPLYSVGDMFGCLDDLQKDGWQPDVVLFDWWGPIRDKLTETNLPQWSDTKARRLQAKWLWEIHGELGARHLRGYIFHQKSGAASAKSPKSVGSSHDAQEDKNFNNFCDFCFVSSRKDADDVVRFSLDKARASGGALMKVRLDGQRCMFVGDTPDYGVSLAESGAEKITQFNEELDITEN